VILVGGVIEALATKSESFVPAVTVKCRDAAEPTLQVASRFAAVHVTDMLVMLMVRVLSSTAILLDRFARLGTETAPAARPISGARHEFNAAAFVGAFAFNHARHFRFHMRDMLPTQLMLRSDNRLAGIVVSRVQVQRHRYKQRVDHRLIPKLRLVPNFVLFSMVSAT
tara:strand:+ start:1554 stop:2057 length:504 start_codon:yes stop_codon:yes gene_type:complete